MPSRKKTSAGSKDSKVSGAESTPSPPEVFFPFARYTSVTGVHTSLLAFAALFLPRTSLSSLVHASPLAEDAEATTPIPPTRDSFRLLTENPLRTVAWICVGALLLQGWWASWLRSWSLESKVFAKGDKDNVEQAKHKLKQKEWGSNWPVAYRNAFIMTLAASVVFYTVIVLFGAPITSHVPQTYVLSLLMSLLTVFTPAYILGLPSWGSDAFMTRMAWIRLFAELSPRTPIERAIVYPAIGTVLGCWAGAIPIGLDWGRAWQAWPLTPVYGAVGGHILGSLGALVVSALKDAMKTDAIQSKAS